MNVKLIEVEKVKDELTFDIVDSDINTVIGILFTVGNHIAYEIWPQFRGNGAATDALKLITSKIDRPVLEIKYNNIASQKVALKSGYKLIRNEYPFGIYEQLDETVKNK